jgi:hypothetical protein
LAGNGLPDSSSDRCELTVGSRPAVSGGLTSRRSSWRIAGGRQCISSCVRNSRTASSFSASRMTLGGCNRSGTKPQTADNVTQRRLTPIEARASPAVPSSFSTSPSKPQFAGPYRFEHARSGRSSALPAPFSCFPGIATNRTNWVKFSLSDATPGLRNVHEVVG